MAKKSNEKPNTTKNDIKHKLKYNVLQILFPGYKKIEENNIENIIKEEVRQLCHGNKSSENKLDKIYSKALTFRIAYTNLPWSFPPITIFSTSSSFYFATEYIHSFIDISIIATILAVFSYIMLLNFVKFVYYSEQQRLLMKAIEEECWGFKEHERIKNVYPYYVRARLGGELVPIFIGLYNFFLLALPDILYWNRSEILEITQYLQSVLHNMYLGLAITYFLDLILYFIIITAIHCFIKKETV
jgi:hypothetical protein